MPGPTHLPTVALVIPVLDDARFLDACLAAVARQRVPPAEVVVVDNGSSDDSADVARAHGARLLHEPRRGIWPASARGYDAVTADVVARCDADSVPPPGWVERVARRFAADPGLAAVTGPGEFYDVGPVTRALADVLYMRTYFALLGAFVGRTPLFGSSMAMRREVWHAVRGEVHDDVARLHDDIDLSFHVRGRVAFDRGLRMPVSGRPFRSAAGMRERAAWGARTTMLHMPGIGPRLERAWRPAPDDGRASLVP